MNTDILKNSASNNREIKESLIKGHESQIYSHNWKQTSIL